MYEGKKGTYDLHRVIKRKDESADAHHGDIQGQERDGSEEVQEGGVCSESLQWSRQFPTPAPAHENYASTADARIHCKLNCNNDARCICCPTRDSGDLCREAGVSYRGR